MGWMTTVIALLLATNPATGLKWTRARLRNKVLQDKLEAESALSFKRGGWLVAQEQELDRVKRWCDELESRIHEGLEADYDKFCEWRRRDDHSALLENIKETERDALAMYHDDMSDVPWD